MARPVQPVSVAQQLAAAFGGNPSPNAGYTSSDWQESVFQFTDNTQLPDSMNNDRWTTGYGSTSSKSTSSKSSFSWW
jgi:hypothetical protein